MKRKIFISFLIIALMSLYFADYSKADSDSNVISVVPFHAPEKIWSLYSPFVDYLNKNTKMKWQLKIYPNHDSIKKALCEGEVLIALLGPILAYISNKECNAEPLILALNEDGANEFKVYIVTADPKIKKITDLKGQKIGLFKPMTVANIVARKMLEDEGLNDTNVDFRIYQTLERIVNDVLTDEIKAGGIRHMNNILFKDFNLRVLKVSEPVPGFAFMASPKVSTSVKKEFVNVLMKLNLLEKNNFNEITKGWDEVIKHGFALPQKGYLKDVEKFYHMYERYKK